MLNANDTQIFVKLIDLLNSSLRDLAGKYEVLLASSNRQIQTQERVDSVVVSMAREVTLSFAAISQNLESLKAYASDSKSSNAKFEASLQALSKTIDSFEKRLAELQDASISVEHATGEGKNIALHVDGHMDGFAAQLASIMSASADVAKMLVQVEEIRKQFQPFQKFAALMSKPAAVIVGVYVIIVTIFATIEGCKKVDQLFSPSKIENEAKTSTNHTSHVTHDERRVR